MSRCTLSACGVVSVFAMLCSLCADAAAFQRVAGHGLRSDNQFSAVDAAAQSIEFFRASDGSPAPPLPVGQFELLPLILAGRAATDSVRHDLPQQVTDLGGVSSIQLTDGGRLLKFRDATRALTGILLIDASGRPSILLEHALVHGQDALSPYVGVSPFEPVAAVVTDRRVAAHGEVFLLSVNGGAFAGTTATTVQVTDRADTEPTSLTFVPGGLLFLGDDTELDRVDTAAPFALQVVSIPPSGGVPPLEFSEEFAVSDDGSSVAFLAGAAENDWDIYVVSAAGVARNVTQSPDAYETVGNQTSHAVGPTLSLGPVGAGLVFGIELPLETEFYFQDLVLPSLPVQLTSDVHFEHSVGDTSTVVLGAARIDLMIGETPVNQDFYQVNLASDGQVGSVLNQTHTSADPDGIPWQTGARLTPVQILRIGAGDSYVVVDDRSTAVIPRFDVWHVRSAGAAIVAGNLRSMPRFVGVREALVLFAEGYASVEIWRLPAQDLAPRRLALAPAAISLGGFAVDVGGRQVAFVASAAPTVEWVLQMDAVTGVLELLTPLPGPCGPQTRFWNGRPLFGFGSNLVWFPAGGPPKQIAFTTGSALFP